MRFVLLTAAFLFVTVWTTLAQVDFRKLDAYYAKALRDWDVPGMSIAIVKDGKVVFSKGYGVKEAGKPEKPDGNTLYAIASNTKAFTAAAIAQLVDEKKLAWDDKVRKYLPYFALYDPWVSEQVTIRDLLCHRVGLGTFSGDILWYRSTLNAEEIIRRVRHLPKAYEFRDGYGYSNVMYLTAGKVIEAVSGQTWHDYIREHFFQPLGMSRSITATRDLQKLGNIASPHKLVNDHHEPMEWEEWATVAAMGGIISSVEDVSKWMILNLNNGMWNKERLFSKDARNTLWTPHNMYRVDHTDSDNSTHMRGYALGWSVADYHGRFRVGHTGGYSGMLSAVTLVPDENLGIVVLTNGLKGIYTPLVNYTIDAFLKIPEKDWSADALNRAKNYKDTRIEERRKARIAGTQPTLPIDKYAGVYSTPAYGDITVHARDGRLRLEFEHTPDLAATLGHWHQDVFEIKWDKPEVLAWFSFGTLRFELDNNGNAKGIRFDVPNDDLWFEELNADRAR